MVTFVLSSQLGLCKAALMVLQTVLSISLESKLCVKVICGKVNWAFSSSQESC